MINVNQGITPACAGKRTICDKLLQFSRDHPRVCGEKFMSAIALWYAVGSPPRVRGKDHRPQAVAPFPGITPACAGKRSGKT